MSQEPRLIRMMSLTPEHSLTVWLWHLMQIISKCQSEIKLNIDAVEYCNEPSGL